MGKIIIFILLIILFIVGMAAFIVGYEVRHDKFIEEREREE